MQQFDELSTLDIFAIFCGILQILNYQQNLEQSSNDDLMKAFHEQNEIYLKRIIEQNDEILNLLRKEK